MMPRSAVDPLFRKNRITEKLMKDSASTMQHVVNHDDDDGQSSSYVVVMTENDYPCLGAFVEDGALVDVLGNSATEVRDSNSFSTDTHRGPDCSALESSSEIEEGANPTTALRSASTSLIILDNDESIMGRNGFVSMREQDADLLESIQLLTNDSIATPSIAAPIQASLSTEENIPILSLDDPDVHDSSTITANSSSCAKPKTLSTNYQVIHAANQKLSDNTTNSERPPIIPPKHHRSRTGITPSTTRTLVKVPTESLCEIPIATSIEPSNPSSAEIARSPMRRALSGEVWTSSLVFGNDAAANEKATTSESKVDTESCPKPIESSSIERANEQSNQKPSTSFIIRRSDSSERRLNETAQFVEAVGEVFLLQDTTIQIIDDDEEGNAYYDDDDDENDGLNVSTQIEKEAALENVNLSSDLEYVPQPLSLSWDDVTRQRKANEAALFASAVGDYELALQTDPSSTILIIDDDDDEFNGQHLDEDEDCDINNSNNKQAGSEESRLGHLPPQEEEPKGQIKVVDVDILLESPSKFTCLKSNEPDGDTNEPQTLSKVASNLTIHTDSIERIKHNTQQGRFAIIRRNRSNGFLDKLPDDYNSAPATAKQLDFVYKGIKSNPPEIVKRGMTRGNYAQLHRKAWLEVSDKYHRYGKNLRLYYRYWESLGFPTNMFFDWLDSKGEAAGQPLPELEECPRSKLDSDTVLYITNPQVTQSYLIQFIPTVSTSPSGTKSTSENEADDSTKQQREPLSQNQSHPPVRRGLVQDANGNPISTGPDGWIFVLRDNEMYGAPKITSVGIAVPNKGTQSSSCSSIKSTPHRQQRFHHSSFFGGKAVAAAGIFITDDDGILTRLYPHSGHYRPGEAHMQRVLFYLYHKGIDLRTFDMDIQQILHVARGDGKEKNAGHKDISKTEKCTSQDNSNVDDRDVVVDDSTAENQNNTVTKAGKSEKKKKVESLHLMPAILVACFLAHKARFIGEGIFAQIHKIRKRGSEITNVTEALNAIDDGGCFWSSSAAAVSNITNTKNSSNENASPPNEVTTVETEQPTSNHNEQ